jgi:hypothetical protein
MDYSLIEALLGLPRIKISRIEQHDDEILTNSPKIGKKLDGCLFPRGSSLSMREANVLMLALSVRPGNPPRAQDKQECPPQYDLAIEWMSGRY